MSTDVLVREEEIIIPTFSQTPRTAFPPIFDPELHYPYEGYLLTSKEPCDVSYKALIIENGLLRVIVLPGLGGRILQIEDIKTGVKYLHENDVVLPVRIGIKHAFICLGMELNFPITHSPTGISEIGWEVIDCDNGGRGVAVGEQEVMWGLNWRTEIKLFPNSRAVCLATKCWNPTKTKRRVQWWTNTAQPVSEGTEFLFANEPIVEHTEEKDRGLWPIVKGVDRRWHKNYDMMCGLFWDPTKSDWFGIYHHDKNWGLLHLSDPQTMPGKKLWTFGQRGSTSDWTLAMTRNGGISCEIQSGLPATQDGFLDMESGDEISFVEFWVPVDSRDVLDDDKRLSYHEVFDNLGGQQVLGASKKQLTSPSGEFWRELINAFESKDKVWLKEHHDCLDKIWPPTGFELEDALKWASSSAGGLWNYATALYLYAERKYAEAMGYFEKSPQSAKVQALLAMLEWKGLKNAKGAWTRLQKVICDIPDGSLLVAANSLLRELDQMAERKKLLEIWPDWDYRKRETEAEIAIDQGDAQRGLDILTGAPWERHHGLRFRRSELWRRAMEMLGRDNSQIPVILGEDPFRVNENPFEDDE